MGKRGLIKFSALRLHPCPSYGKTEELATEGGCGSDVLLVTIPEIRRPPARSQALASFPKIPDILPARVISLGLMVRVCSAKQKTLWKFKIQNSNLKSRQKVSLLGNRKCLSKPDDAARYTVGSFDLGDRGAVFAGEARESVTFLYRVPDHDWFGFGLRFGFRRWLGSCFNYRRHRFFLRYYRADGIRDKGFDLARFWILFLRDGEFGLFLFARRIRFEPFVRLIDPILHVVSLVIKGASHRCRFGRGC